MRAHSLTLSVAAAFGALALFATPAEAGGCRKHHKHYKNCYSRNDYGYYPRARHYEPRYYYQPVRYVPAPVYYNPGFQIGFVFGGNGYGRCR